MKHKGLEVKNYWSPDIQNPWGWEPENNSVFYLLEMNIGIKGDAASDIYSIVVATPEGILNLRSGNGNCFFSSVHKILLLNTYCWSDVRKIIEDKLSDVKNTDAVLSASELSSFFNWEYDGAH